eukprot:1161009-Pelagomonas_calceolata.AAC.12
MPVTVRPVATAWPCHAGNPYPQAEMQLHVINTSHDLTQDLALINKPCPSRCDLLQLHGHAMLALTLSGG